MLLIHFEWADLVQWRTALRLAKLHLQVAVQAVANQIMFKSHTLYKDGRCFTSFRNEELKTKYHGHRRGHLAHLEQESVQKSNRRTEIFENNRLTCPLTWQDFWAVAEPATRSWSRHWGLTFGEPSCRPSLYTVYEILKPIRSHYAHTGPGEGAECV